MHLVRLTSHTRSYDNTTSSYTTTWRESKYTLIHFDTRHKKRGSTLKAAMDKMDEKHGIKSSIVHGYESLSSNTNDEQLISDHPGFKRIVQQLNSNRDELRIWLQEGDVTTNKKGVLWNHLEFRDPALMTRGQLVEKAAQLLIMNQKYDTLKAENENMKRMLEYLNPTLQRHMDTKPPPSTHTILTKYRVYKPLRDVMKIVGKLSKKLNETPSHDGSGEIYAAVNPMMQHLYKMGFTYKDAETRVKALQTAGVLEPFELIRCAKVADAR